VTVDELPTFFAKRVSVNGQAIIKLGGECDVATLDELKRVLREVVSEHPDELVIDLREATFVDSLTLGALTASAKHMRTNGGRFRLVGATAVEIRRALQITGLDSYLHIAGDSSPVATVNT
jgi:anti-anti-sigma factor